MSKTGHHFFEVKKGDTISNTSLSDATELQKYTVKVLEVIRQHQTFI